MGKNLVILGIEKKKENEKSEKNCRKCELKKKKNQEIRKNSGKNEKSEKIEKNWPSSSSSSSSKSSFNKANISSLRALRKKVKNSSASSWRPSSTLNVSEVKPNKNWKIDEASKVMPTGKSSFFLLLLCLLILGKWSKGANSEKNSWKKNIRKWFNFTTITIKSLKNCEKF